MQPQSRSHELFFSVHVRWPSAQVLILFF